MKFNTFPELVKEGLFLRQINEVDSDVILFLHSDQSINKFIKRAEIDKTKNRLDSLNFIKKMNKGI